MKLNKQELQFFWIDADEIADSDYYYDKCGNKYGWAVFSYKGEYYRLQYLNGSPVQKSRTEKIYELEKVERHVKIVEEVTWEKID